LSSCEIEPSEKESWDKIWGNFSPFVLRNILFYFLFPLISYVNKFSYFRFIQLLIYLVHIIGHIH
jgi:hypothetical protein